MKKITEEVLKTLGFVFVSNLIQNSWMLILKNEKIESEMFDTKTLYNFRAISVAECNDKGLGEYYLFLREGDTDKRHEDIVISLTRNLLYEGDLREFIRLLTL